MNEQELLMKQKIEKREKFDTMLAYILIVILLACILIVVYLKFIKKEDVATNTTPEEHTVSYITLSQIASYLNSSELANEYINDGANFNSTATDGTLNVSYVKEDKNINLDMTLEGSELKVTLDEANKEFITKIYKEIATIVCSFYNNDEASCRVYVKDINDTVDGIRFEGNDVYIDINKGVTLPVSSEESGDERIYTSATTVEVSDTNYKLNIQNTEIQNITLLNTDTEYKVGATITSTTPNDTLTVVIKLYDENENVIGENKKEYNGTLNESDVFEVAFPLNDTLKLENIKKYSIDVVR